MSSIVSLVVLVLAGILLLRRPRQRELVGSARFLTPLTCAVIGLLISALQPPATPLRWGLLGAGVVLGLLVGWGRAALTRVRLADDGRVQRRATRAANALYLVLVAGAAAVGHWDSLHDLGRGAAVLGQAFLVVAASSAVEAELVWRRAKRLGDVPAASGSR